MSARGLVVASGVVLFCAGAANAAPPKLAAQIQAYADKNGLPVRIIKNDLGTREVERHFVPVLPTTHDSFLEHFLGKNGAVIWRSYGNAVHPVIGLERGATLVYNRTAPSDEGIAYGPNGYYLTLALEPQQLEHWNAFIATYAPKGQLLYGGGLTAFTQAMQAQGRPAHGTCMWWLVHAELAPELNLATAMGVRRAKGPEILAPRLIHAGNELVGPIGIPVNSIEQFNAMTNQQLLGPEPAGGAAEQAKP
jgi:hypothetical protein